MEIERPFPFTTCHQDLGLESLLELLVEESILFQVIYFEEIVDHIEQSFFASAIQLNAHLIKFTKTDPQDAHFGVCSSL
jgi:hypothetical protein